MGVKRGKNWVDSPRPGPDGFRVRRFQKDMNYRPDPSGQPDRWDECRPGWADEGDRWASRKQRMPIEAFKQAGQGIKLELPGKGFLTIVPDGASVPTVTWSEDNVLLEGLWTATDLRVQPQRSGMKSTYILNSNAAPSSFDWGLSVTGTNVIAFEDGTVTVRDDGGSLILRFVPPFIDIDLANDPSAVRMGSLSLDQQGGQYTMTATMPDTSGLSYPIEVDPTATYYEDGGTGEYHTYQNWNENTPTTWANFPTANTSSRISDYFYMELEATGTTSPNWWGQEQRPCIAIDTSDLSAGMKAGITQATLNWYVSGASDIYTAFQSGFHICEYTGTETLSDANWAAYGTTSFHEATDLPTTTDQYWGYDLNASGIAALSTTGVTKWGILTRDRWDDTEPGPTMAQNNRIFMSSNSALGATYLDITYIYGPLDGYQVLKDDGAEGSNTSYASEDTAGTVPLDTTFRLRVQMDSPVSGSLPYRLLTREDSGSPWKAVE